MHVQSGIIIDPSAECVFAWDAYLVLAGKINPVSTIPYVFEVNYGLPVQTT